MNLIMQCSPAFHPFLPDGHNNIKMGLEALDRENINWIELDKHTPQW